LLARKFLFPRDKIKYNIPKKIVYLLLILSLLPVVSSCNAKKIWDIPLARFRLKLKDGDYSFLQHIDYEKVDLEEVRRLNPNAPFYFYYIFKKLGLDNVSKRMLELAYKDGRDIWKERAGLMLLKSLVKGERYEEALKIADSILPDSNGSRGKNGCFPNSDIVEIKRLKVESLYWLKRDRDVVRLIKSYSEEKDSGFNLFSDRELNLFLAVSSCRLGIDKWREDFRRLYFDFYSSFVHSRGYAFLKRREERLKAFDAFTLDVFRFKDLIGRGLKKNALQLGEKIVKENPAKVSKESPLLVKELGFLYLSLGEYTRGIKFLGYVYPQLVGMARLNGMEMLGRICRKAKRYEEAILYLRRVANDTLDKAQRDRVNWFVIDMYLNYSTKRALDYIVRTYPYWSNYLYFEDVLNSLVSKLVMFRRWDELYQLYNLVRGRGPIDIEKRLILILDIAVRRGFITLSFKEQIRLNSDIVEVVKSCPPDYYVLMLSVIEDELVNSRTGGEKFMDFCKSSVAAASEADVSSDFFDFVRGFFDFGLDNEGYLNLMENPNLLSDEELLNIATVLNERGIFRQSINIVGLYLSRIRATIRKEGVASLNMRKGLKELYYPKAYAGAIVSNAKRYGIPEYVLFALVREESYFDPKIVSRAGAVGLTQLLPVTAMDVARKLRLGKPDLKDPVVNIELGAKHLGDLYKRLNSMAKALVAYNAGLSRVRKWEREFRGLNDVLFIEALPFSETREYVKKIILSSVYYSSLKPNNVIRYYFGEF